LALNEEISRHSTIFIVKFLTTFVIFVVNFKNVKSVGDIGGVSVITMLAAVAALKFQTIGKQLSAVKLCKQFGRN
jgi:hypothetical protein